jgi:hypothetical protein
MASMVVGDSTLESLTPSVNVASMPKYLQACRLEYTIASKLDPGKAIDPNCYGFWGVDSHPTPQEN